MQSSASSVDYTGSSAQVSNPSVSIPLMTDIAHVSSPDQLESRRIATVHKARLGLVTITLALVLALVSLLVTGWASGSYKEHEGSMQVGVLQICTNQGAGSDWDCSSASVCNIFRSNSCGETTAMAALISTAVALLSLAAIFLVPLSLSFLGSRTVLAPMSATLVLVATLCTTAAWIVGIFLTQSLNNDYNTGASSVSLSLSHMFIVGVFSSVASAISTVVLITLSCCQTSTGSK